MSSLGAGYSATGRHFSRPGDEVHTHLPLLDTRNAAAAGASSVVEGVGYDPLFPSHNECEEGDVVVDGACVTTNFTRRQKFSTAPTAAPTPSLPAKPEKTNVRARDVKAIRMQRFSTFDSTFESDRQRSSGSESSTEERAQTTTEIWSARRLKKALRAQVLEPIPRTILHSPPTNPWPMSRSATKSPVPVPPCKPMSPRPCRSSPATARSTLGQVVETVGTRQPVNMSRVPKHEVDALPCSGPCVSSEKEFRAERGAPSPSSEDLKFDEDNLMGENLTMPASLPTPGWC